MKILLIILVVLWFLGYIRTPGFSIPRLALFDFNGQTITLFDLLIFLVAIWVISLLPSPFRLIVGLMFIFWLVSTMGILAFTGLPQLILLAIIFGVALSFLK